MKNNFSFALLSVCLLIAVSCSAQKIKGQGPNVTVDLQLDKFESIGLAISADVILTQGSPQKVKITGQQNIIDNIRKTVRSGSWEIGFDKNTWNHNRLTIEITMETLEELAISGSGKVKTTNAFKTNGDFELAISGSGDADLNISAEDIECSISGSGEANLKGQADDLEINISGSGEVNAYDLPVSTCEVNTSGSGDAEVNVKGSLEASVAGSGGVTYTGQPKVKASVVGSGKVRSR